MIEEYWRDRRVLVTGGAGFIGSNLCETLVGLGAKIRVADNLERGKIEYLQEVSDRIEFHQLDLRDRKGCELACEGVDVVFHLASKVGGIGYYLSKPGEVILSNSVMDALMLEAAIGEGVDRYLYASSAHVYPIELQLDPESPPIGEAQAYPASPELSYGWSKILAEKQIEAQITEGRDLKAAIVRLVGAYGKNQDIDLATGSVIPVFCRRAIEYPRVKPFRIWGSGRETRSYCYIDDVVDGLIRCVEKLEDQKLVGPINLGAEGRLRIGRIAELIIGISGKPIEIVMDESKETTIWGQAVDCSEARKVLDNWEASTSIEDGLVRTYRHIERRIGDTLDQ